MISGEYSGLLIIAVLVGATYYFGAAPGSIAGQNAIGTESAFHVVRREHQTDGVLVVRGRDGALLGEFGIVDNQLYQTPQQERDGTLVASLRRDYFLLDSGFDFGAWAGYSSNKFDDERIDVGLRISPVRLLYGTIAPDLVAGTECVGLGVSLFPPPRLVGQHWRHLGIGAWYCAPYDGGDPGAVYGLSFSIR